MIGSGRASVAEICDISRANVADGSTAEALAGLMSLGGNGKHQSEICTGGFTNYMAAN